MMAAVAGLDAAFDYRISPTTSLSAWMQRHTPSVLVGMSLGGHLCVRNAPQIATLNGLIVIAPAWTDQPDPRYAAHINGIEHMGIHQHLAHLPKQPTWVRNAVVQAWNEYPDELLLTHLMEAANTPGPGLAALQAVRVPTVIVGFWDDPFHPWSVAEQWAAEIPNSRLIGMPRASAGRDLRNIGHAAVTNLQDLGGWLLGDTGSGRG
jgi:pimeloyl-ACP methyl ester carboxylesterase